MEGCKGDERQEAQTFEKDFMHVFGVDWHEGLHEYQVRDAQGKIGYIDYLLPDKILIEMKREEKAWYAPITRGMITASVYRRTNELLRYQELTAPK